MAPVNEPKDEKHEKAQEHWTEKAKSGRKRKMDDKELENEPQTKRLFTRELCKPPEKIGWSGGGSMVRNHQLKWQHNIVHYLYQNMLGGSIQAQFRKCLQLPFLHSLASYHTFRKAKPFNRRVACLEWHPVHPSTVAVGSRGGDIILWDYQVPKTTCFIEGMGAGGAITGMKFNPFNSSQLYTSSVAGNVTLQDFNGRRLWVFSTEDWQMTDFTVGFQIGRSGCNLVIGQKVNPNSAKMAGQKGPGDSLRDIKFNPFEAVKLSVALGDGTLSLQDLEGRAVQMISHAPDCDHKYHNVCSWYCSVDVSASCHAVATGDNIGNLILLSTSGQQISKVRSHRKKVTHVEFNSHCEWLLATASLDQSVKIWDLRNLRNRMNFLHMLPHNRALSAASFSPRDGAKLLTTDQRNEIRIYSSSDWTKPQHVISHPHRQFGHLAPIKATWHPRYDLIVAGRYPDPKFPGYVVDELRTVDVFDGNTGEMVYQVHDRCTTGIFSINKFNPMGDVLASGMGYHILIWSQKMVANE